MFVLRIEHPVPNFEAWKKEGFDSDPLNRQESGVQFHRIYRPTDNAQYAMIDLGFQSHEEAQAMLDRLIIMWGNVKDRFGWTETPKATITELIEDQTV